MGKMRVGKGLGSELRGKIRDLDRSELTRHRRVRVVVGDRVSEIGKRRGFIVEEEEEEAIDDLMDQVVIENESIGSSSSSMTHAFASGLSIMLMATRPMLPPYLPHHLLFILSYQSNSIQLHYSLY